MSYTVPFSDPNKSANPITVNDLTENITSTSLSLVGRNYSNYGVSFAKNFVHLLENFASSTPPNNSIEGQLWYDNNKKRLFARMLSNSWYTANYFNLSYGKSDVLKNQISAVSEIENIAIHLNRETVFRQLDESKNQKTTKILNHFDKQVPHWFLSPWFEGLTGSDSERKNKIYELNGDEKRKSLYFLKKEV
jgi:hypothetical protein